MINNRLRIYYGPQESVSSSVLGAETKSRSTVSATAGEVFGMLKDAIESNAAWLRDFENDDVTISTDLYEVLLAYQHIRRPSA
jgi:hypothetical protein